MVIDERECRREEMAAIARQIMIAGRTAPKGKGIDIIEIVTVTGETIAELAGAVRDASAATGIFSARCGEHPTGRRRDFGRLPQFGDVAELRLLRLPDLRCEKRASGRPLCDQYDRPGDRDRFDDGQGRRSAGRQPGDVLGRIRRTADRPADRLPRSLRHSAQRIFQKSVFRQTIDTLIIALYV